MTATFDDLRSWSPCWPAERIDELEAQYEPEPWTALDVLALDDISAEDRLWVVLRPELLSDRTLRLFACDCAERACSRVGWDDPRSLGAIEVARRYALGDASDELAADWAAAWAAALDALDAARAAGAAASAARAAWAAAGAANRDAAWNAAKAAARAAALDASAAVWDAWDAAGAGVAWAAMAARVAAGDAERQKQLEALKALIAEHEGTP